MKRTGEILTQQLIDWGVDHIYGMPGDSINEFVNDLRNRSEELSFIQVRHEEVGALSAAAYGKVTGKLGVCMSIAGPGGIHLLNGLYDAKMDGAPVLAIVGQVNSDEVGTGAFQEVNLERMFDDVAVYNKRVQRADQLPDLLNKAVREAYAHKGVSVLIVPDDVFAVKQKPEATLTSSQYVKPEIFPAEQSLVQARQAIEEAEKPIILAGQGAFGAQEELVSFAERIKSPVILSLLAKGLLPDHHPLNLGHHGQIGTKPAYHAMMEADLVIMIGTSFPYRDFMPKDTKAIQIDHNPARIGNHYPVSIGLAGDAKQTLQWLTNHVVENENDDYLQKYQKHMKNWHIGLQEQKRDDSSPLHAPQVMYALENVMEDRAIVSTDVGNSTVWVSRFLPMTTQRMLISGWLATMGCGLPGAIAAQKAYPDQQVIAVVGDGGFSMVMHDFATAVKYDLPIKIILLNNSKIGMIQFEQEAMGHLHYGTDFGGVDFAKFAESCGGEGYAVNRYEELNDAMQQAFLSKKPAIIDVAVEDQAPLPGKVSYTQAINYSKYLIKEFFETGEIGKPPILKGIQRVL
ncbi:pyruvate oxidase [Pontibacillus halophilus JSM 076056 = DSM 19796]|uniref:Pyruvate oxidase n=1 Tax=Pontibacillus halophilus JSM 076056 = DSM 19796 TaxID=1385510 RepID=A0A0A5GEC7_9BACI|nr:pyruvate oxidase [Pontibacillus halophilus]KGX91561.1 pyruvate oxidase [Pontibacillus halophilus JSM 076056 = DSM 19796]